MKKIRNKKKELIFLSKKEIFYSDYNYDIEKELSIVEYDHLEYIRNTAS
ncbi:MAG: hypothetical protein ACTSXH_11485 [Promethearchaeota archaeon]